MLCCKRKIIETTIVPINENGKKYKDLTKMYKINTFFLTIGLMFPNPQYDDRRKILVGCEILSCIPCFVIVCNDMRLRILNGDVENLVRQSIIVVSLLFVKIKLIISLIRKKELREIIDGMNKDYESFNNLPEEDQVIVDDTIKKTRRLEKVWLAVLGLTAASYPVLAAVNTIYSQFTDSPRRYMVHESSVIFLTEDMLYSTPFFELITLYSLYIVWIVFVGFTGYDGMFSISILHVSLKLKLISQNLSHLMDDDRDLPAIREKVANFVKDHCEIQRLIEKIQKCFEVWLVGIFCNAVVQIGMALTQTTNKSGGGDINAMYYLFVLATVLHIYLPCYLTSDVTHNASEVANHAYSCCWESVQDTGVRRSVVMIIKKAQVLTCFKALGMLTFNMEMFVSILQTSYSMYTLLRK